MCYSFEFSGFFSFELKADQTGPPIMDIEG